MSWFLSQREEGPPRVVSEDVGAHTFTHETTSGWPPALPASALLPLLNVFLLLLLPTQEPQHPLVMPGEHFADYLPRTEQYWVRLAQEGAGPDAKEKKVLKVAQAMAKAFFEDSA